MQRTTDIPFAANCPPAPNSGRSVYLYGPPGNGKTSIATRSQEGAVDFMGLHTGKKIETPFEQLVVFSTNLDSADLVDDAFPRRIGHKIKVDDPTTEEFHHVYCIMCQMREVEYTKAGLVHLVRERYAKSHRAFKNPHPRNVLDPLLDTARYKRLKPVAAPEIIDRACSAIFID